MGQEGMDCAFVPEQPSSFRFPPREHLKKRADIRLAFKKGRCVSTGGAKLFYIKNGLAWNRIAFTFARKFGNAVRRNRARRLGRECYRQMRGSLDTGWDLVLLLYPEGVGTGGAAGAAKTAGTVKTAGAAGTAKMAGTAKPAGTVKPAGAVKPAGTLAARFTQWTALARRARLLRADADAR